MQTSVEFIVKERTSEGTHEESFSFSIDTSNINEVRYTLEDVPFLIEKVCQREVPYDFMVDIVEWYDDEFFARHYWWTGGNMWYLGADDVWYEM